MVLIFFYLVSLFLNLGLDSDDSRIHDFVVGVHGEHGLRLEILTALFTLTIHDISIGRIYLVICSTSLLICVVCFCALYGTQGMTVGLALTMVAQTLIAISDVSSKTLETSFG